MTDVTPLDRKRAKNALDAVSSLVGQGGVASGYKSYVKGAPAMILTLGLGQALATFLARAGNDEDKGQGGTPAAYRTLFDHTTNWLFAEDPTGLLAAEREHSDPARRIAALLALGQRDYLILQSEALAHLEWQKKFANALLAGTPEAAA
jgi:CRISPR type III-B/RAMP module-associated protein Cmr5